MDDPQPVPTSSIFRIWPYVTGTVTIVASVLTIAIYFSGKPYFSDWRPARATDPVVTHETGPAEEVGKPQPQPQRPAGNRGSDNAVKNFAKGFVVVYGLFFALVFSVLTVAVDLVASLFTHHAMPLTRALWQYAWEVVVLNWFWYRGHAIVSIVSIVCASCCLLVPMAGVVREENARRSRRRRRRRRVRVT